MRSTLGHGALPALVLSLIVDFGLSGTARADCIDYAGYLHMIGHVDAPGYGEAVALDGNYAYIADDDSGLVVADVSNPAAPKIVGSLPYLVPITAIAVAGRYGYIIGGSFLGVVDISSPSRPQYAGYVFVPGACDVAVKGGYAYVAGNGFYVVDVSNPMAPVVVANLPVGSSDGGVAVLGTVAYLATTYSNELYTVDISNPVSPRILGNVALPLPVDVAVYHNYAYVADLGDGLVVVDVSKPASPKIVGSEAMDWATSVAVSDTIAYVGSDEGGNVALIDVANPGALRPIGSAGCTGLVGGTAVRGAMVYVATFQGLDVIDVTNPNSPPIRANLALPGYGADIVTSGSTAYVADSDGGVQIVDVSTPTSPRSLGAVATPDACCGVATAGQYLYAADYSAGLHVIDISYPAAAHIVGSVSLPGEANDVEVSGNYAYVAGVEAGLVVVDILNSLVPAFLGNVAFSDAAVAVAVSGTTPYVAAEGAGLQVVDCSRPAARASSAAWAGSTRPSASPSWERRSI